MDKNCKTWKKLGQGRSVAMNEQIPVPAAKKEEKSSKVDFKEIASNVTNESKNKLSQKTKKRKTTKNTKQKKIKKQKKR